ncbi:MAG TPA: enoyl-CoA hydratase/isomerase family protein [Thermoanaerobaculia bacterium]|nr:enoyl-CoA hydratase/isomerase family protein [Thermoanaerobaculia bacterium]
MAQPTTAEEVAQRTLVHYEVREGVAYLTLDDPPANTYTHEMMRQLDAAILEARFDKNVYVLVLAGKGEKFFCAGADINMLKTADPHFKYYFCLHANETLNRLEQTPKLVIAALQGHTVGGGLEIAMAADLLIAKQGSGKVGLPEINLGVLPGTGGTQRLARRVGKNRAIDLMITGRLISFEEAEGMGIVNKILDGDDFLGQIHAYARQFCPPHRASKAVGRIKRSVQSGAEVPFESGLAIERELQQQLFESADAKEGLDAYVSKRQPQFKGV